MLSTCSKKRVRKSIMPKVGVKKHVSNLEEKVLNEIQAQRMKKLEL